MFNFDFYTLKKNVRIIENVLTRGDAAQAEADKMKADIQADKDHSQSWKDKELTKVNNALHACFLEGLEPVEALKEYFVSVPDMARAAYSFNDADLQTAISMIDTMKNGLPYQTKIDIIQNFKGNPEALEVIRAMYKKYEFPEEKNVKEALNLFSMFARIGDIFDEFIGYASQSGYQKAWDVNVTPVWKSDIMQRLMDRFKAAFNIDTSIHPLIVEIKKLYENVADNTVRARIKRFLEAAEKEIENNNSAMVEKGERYLSEGFSKYLVL